MKHKRLFLVLIILVILLGAASPLAADWQFDIGLNVPLFVGISTPEEDFQQALDYAFIFPDFKAHYFWGSDLLRVGVGARAFTLILETLLYPTITAEVDIDPFRFTGSIGGQAFLFFGLYNDIVTGNLWLPEVTAAYKVNDWFQAGAGLTGMIFFDEDDIVNEAFPYVVYAFGRFSFGGGK